MRLLLDTCTFIWIATEPEKLSESALEMFRDPENDVYLSAVSAWEISHKFMLKKLKIPEGPDVFVPKQREQHHISELRLSEMATLQLFKLPNLHRDPFDRMLICEAIQNGMSIMTPDPLIRKYPVKTLW